MNRFDVILESINKKYELKHIQVINFDEDTKNLLLSILTFTRYLWENCINRNIYNSYEVSFFFFFYIYIYKDKMKNENLNF